MSTKTAEGISSVTARSARLLRELGDENAQLKTANAELTTKVASYERAERVRALARSMEDRGLSPEHTFEEKVASISQYADLDQLETAIKLAGGGKLDLPRVSDERGTPEDVGRSTFHNFLVTGHSGS